MARLLLSEHLILCELLHTEDTASLGSILCFLTCSPHNRGDFFIQPGLVQLQHILSTRFEDLSGAHSFMCWRSLSQHLRGWGLCGSLLSSWFSFLCYSFPSFREADHTHPAELDLQCLWSYVQLGGHQPFMEGFLCRFPVLCRQILEYLN